MRKMSCYGLYGSTDECQFCTAKYDCEAATKRKFKSWVRRIENPKPEETSRERERRLNKAGMHHWFEREKFRNE